MHHFTAANEDTLPVTRGTNLKNRMTTTKKQCNAVVKCFSKEELIKCSVLHKGMSNSF